jgi:dephospho-CoA kinase
MRFNELIFPYIQEEIQSEIAASAAKGYSVIFLDAPTLFESGSEVFCDKVVSVIAPKDIRRERLLARDTDRTMEEIDKRIDAQHDDEFYTSRSDFVINNDGDVTALRFQVVEMLEVCCRNVERPDGGLA